MDLILSVDLGTSGDFTAITVLERIPRFQETGRPIHLSENKTVVNEIHVRHLQRLELGMKYTEIIEAVREGLEPSRAFREDYTAGG